MLSIEQLRKGLTFAEAKAAILAVLVTVGFVVTAWPEGGIALAIVDVLATVYSAFTLVAAAAINGGFLDTAEGAWLTYKAKSDYDVTRFPATFVAGKIRLTNTGGGLYIIEPGDLTFAHGTTKKTYRNTSGGTLSPGPGTTLDLDIIAEEVGTASNALPGTITTMVATLLEVTATNVGALVGQDEESDDSLRIRCRLSMGRLSPNGPKIAYEYYARSAVRADGSAIGVTRVRFPTPPGDGSFQIILATASGGVAGDPNDDSTDLGIIVRDIKANVLPWGVGPVLIFSAEEVEIAVTAHVYVRAAAGLSTGAVTDLAEAALAAHFPLVPIAGWNIGGTFTLPKNGIQAAIENVSAHFINVVVSIPAGNTTLDGDQVPIAGATSIVVTQVADA